MMGYLLASPLDCVDASGKHYAGDNPLAGLPVPDSWGTPSNCTPGQTMAGQAVDAVIGPGAWKDAVSGFVKTISTFWVKAPSPTVADAATHTVTGPASQLQDHLLFYTMIVMAICIAIQGARIAWKEHARGLEDMFTSLIRFVIVTTIGAGTIAIVLSVGDAYASWIIDAATQGSDFATNLNALISDPSTQAGLAVVAAYALLGIAAVASLIQLVLMFFRAGVVVILIGGWPLSTSASMLQAGKQWFTTYTGVLVAFALYKPAAATIYAGGFMLIGTPAANADATATILQGVSVIVIAIVAIGFLVKLCCPATAPISGGRGAGALIGGAALLAAR